MASKSGVLCCSSSGIEVSFSSLLWFKSHGEQQKIRDYWQEQGYQEPIPLPYERTQDGLIVKRNLEDFGWAVGTGTLDRRVYELPF